MSKQNTKKVTRQCPICANTVGEVVHHQQFLLPDTHCLPAAYDVVACRKCGFAYADTSAQQDDYDRYYQDFSKYESAGLSTGGGTTELDVKRLHKTALDIARALPDRKASILDIGCANGGLLTELKRAGYSNVTGMDPSPACIAYVKRQGIQAYIGGLFPPTSPVAITTHHPYDCIILSHVLEHVCALQEAVALLAPRLQAEGILYVEVPDASRYHEYPIVPYYYFDCEHINHFDEYALGNLIAPFGFDYIGHAKKDIDVAGDNRYPAVYAMFRKTAKKHGAATIAYHDTVIKSVQEHVRQSMNSTEYPVLHGLMITQEPIVVWGAGSYALRLLKSTSLGKCNIVAFVDKDKKKQNTRIGDVLIQDPAYLYGFSGTVVVCAALHHDAIVSELKCMHISCNVVSAG